MVFGFEAAEPGRVVGADDEAIGLEERNVGFVTNFPKLGVPLDKDAESRGLGIRVSIRRMSCTLFQDKMLIMEP